MNLLLLHPDELSHDRRLARVTGRRAEHVRRVHRASVGRQLRVGVVDGPVGEGRVETLDDSGVELSLVWSGAPPADLGVHLVLALPRPKVLGRLLRDVACLGVKRLTLMNAARVEASYWQNHRLAPAFIREQLLLGLEQARDTLLPRVDFARGFRPFVEDRLSQAEGHRLLLHPSSEAPHLTALPGFATLVIGPEGGFIPFELSLLQASGFIAHALGPRILRVETVVPVALGRLRPDLL
ncbi:MAG: 16S rRNA (uracil(1498)-N(3))-methyltransferase [Polyangiaceae bacterium]|nr:16S rRNA (uracil(1498)-N(3))-methyltransferase [Polyangiaceae bacterium]MCW5790436.1 16S rRNA (uracil(1498)-N(3))-methyltransferase [Polyangiaceae bacterium]